MSSPHVVEIGERKKVSYTYVGDYSNCGISGIHNVRHYDGEEVGYTDQDVDKIIEYILVVHRNKAFITLSDIDYKKSTGYLVTDRVIDRLLANEKYSHAVTVTRSKINPNSANYIRLCIITMGDLP